MTSRPMQSDEFEVKCRKLEDELYDARRVLLDLMPSEIMAVMEAFTECDSRAEFSEWRKRVIDMVLKKAGEQAPEADLLGEVRVQCPLCGREAFNPSGGGFKMPEGLRRHLIGWGNAEPCRIMHHVRHLALGHLEWRFREQTAHEAAEHAAKAAADKRRRGSEALFQLGPGSVPERLDEDILLWGDKPRDSESLAWAVKRLELLGFSERQEENVRAFVYQAGDWVVYADPREAGKIRFHVYRVAGSKAKKGESVAHKFYMLDKWKYELVRKFKERLANATKSG